MSSTDRPDAPPRARLLILGATGRVGRLLERAFERSSTILPRFCKQPRSGHARAAPENSTDWCIWDSTRSLPRMVASDRPLQAVDAVLNLAGGPQVDAAVETRLALDGLQLAARLGAGVFLQASSAAVYGAAGRSERPLREDLPLRPETRYGRAKAAMERALAERAGSIAPEVPVCILRIGNVAGADSLLPNIQAATDERPLVLDRWADGSSPLRSYIGPLTLAEVVAGLVHRRAVSSGSNRDDGVPGVLNVAAPRPVSMDALIAAARRAGMAFPLVSSPAPPDARRVVVLDTRRLQAIHPFRAADSDPDEMIRQWQDCRHHSRGRGR